MSTTSQTPTLVGRSATELAALVHRGVVSPREIVEAHLDQVDRLEGQVGAFRVLRRDQALAEAEALGGADDLASRPLAGVPVVIKDNVAVAGHARTEGSAAMPSTPAPADHPVVARLRAAGAVVLGITRMPELGLWATTEGTHNPWNLERTPGGSSGGSAAAVSSGMVPVAHANDGLGSVRIPAACTGLVGIKPGPGVVPTQISPNEWYGMAENGALATTVADLASTFSVMADDPRYADITPTDRPLRVAVSYRSPLPGTSVDREWKAAAVRAGRALESVGHGLEHDEVPYSIPKLMALFPRWYAGAADDADEAEWDLLQRRTRVHVSLGRRVRDWNVIDPRQAAAFAEDLAPFFDRYDVLVTPTLAQPPIRADGWEHRGWLANMVAGPRYAPMCAPWNLAAFPAAAVPAGQHPDGTPLSVQLVARPGQESLLLSVARQLEQTMPWRRHAPVAGLD